MNIVENPAKVGRIATIIIIVTLIILAINALITLSRGEANESTSINRLIAKTGVVILVGTVVFVVGVGMANKRNRNKLNNPANSNVQSSTDFNSNTQDDRANKL